MVKKCIMLSLTPEFLVGKELFLIRKIYRKAEANRNEDF